MLDFFSGWFRWVIVPLFLFLYKLFSIYIYDIYACSLYTGFFMRLCVLYVVWFLCYDTWFFEACYEVNMGCSLNATCMYSCILFVFVLHNGHASVSLA